ncbi:TniB family NTP-binding protein (plasmid) [Streptomyces sp. BI20]|uniref:TniB family NTP-binding protein n=1 Tax=Streptomyces sp. BI20 TaxID=3403460 RepID=UPI003C7862B2
MNGEAIRRDTAAGWKAWRVTRHSFTPAPCLSPARWRALPPAERAAWELARAATHANLPLLGTPMSRAVDHLLSGRIRQNAFKARPATRAGVMVSGGGYQGKTETVCEIAAVFEDSWRALHATNPDAVPGARDLWVPVAYVQTPVTAKPKSTCKAILDFYGAPNKNMDLPELIRQVADSLDDHGTKVLILDDITRLRMHRVDDQDTLDLIRAFMSMHVTLVLVGVDIPGSGLLNEGRTLATGQTARRPVNGWEPTQTQRRFDLVELDRFRYDSPDQITAWTSHLAGVENHLRLLNTRPGFLTDGTMPEYLYARTDGVVGLLERLIEDGCTRAITTGAETLTPTLLDELPLTLAGATGRHQEAGEIPTVPTTPQPASRTGRGHRNGAFDDTGTPPIGATA